MKKNINTQEELDNLRKVEVGDEVLLNWVKAVKVEDETYVVPITEVIFIYE